MKQAFEYFVSAFLATLLIAVIIGTFNITAQIREANAYHNLAIAEVEASDFDASVIAKYATGQVNSKIKTTFKDASVTDNNDEFYANERIYQVTTTYKLSLPILHYEKENKIIGYAR